MEISANPEKKNALTYKNVLILIGSYNGFLTFTLVYNFTILIIIKALANKY